MYSIVDPARGELVEEFPGATDEHVDHALDQAYSAWHDWRRTPPGERSKVLTRAAEEFTRRADELAGIITLEMGKRIDEARGEVALVASIFGYYAEHAEDLLADQPLPVASGRATIQKASIGPVLGIMPWNFPYYQAARFAAPNLVLGNAVLYKPAPNCPRSGAAFAEVLATAGVPEGVFATLYASNEQVERLIADPRLRGVSLTGSERAGAAVGATASKHLKPVVLELGGSDPMLILDVADARRAGATAAAARMFNSGQACNSPKRMIVMDGLYDDFLAGLTETLAGYQPGDPADPGTTLAPLASRDAMDRLLEQIDRAVDQGATVGLGGAAYDGPGCYVRPTVLTDVDDSMDAYREELFGPVAMVFRVESEAEAVALANDTSFGLGACIFSDDEQQVARVTRDLDCGMVYVNQPERSQADVPFGGVKRSGVGRELGALGVEAFMNQKVVRH